jgi:hypothetical protein
MHARLFTHVGDLIASQHHFLVNILLELTRNNVAALVISQHQAVTDYLAG